MQDSKTNINLQKIKNINKRISNSLNDVSNIAIATKINQKQFLLDFIKGGLSEDEAWFIRMENNNEFVVLPEPVLNRLLCTIKANNEEKIFITLKHELKELFPADLDDVMIIALQELEKYRLNDGNLPIINAKQVAKKIKKDHPNLFLNFPNFFA